MDGVLLLVTSPRRVCFLVAEKSFKKRVIGDFMAAVGSIPVSRPQDAAKAGPGKLRIEGRLLSGQGTAFTKLQLGDLIRPDDTSEAFKLVEILGDCEALIAEDHSQPVDESHNSLTRSKSGSGKSSFTSANSLMDEEQTLLQPQKWKSYDILKPGTLF